MNSKEQLIRKFEEEMKNYTPNWKNIVERNEAIINIDVFAERMKKIRLSRNLTLAEVGQKISYPRQSIHKIENGNLKKIPVHKLEVISGSFSVSIAYLLGFINDEEKVVDKTEYYFWEHPNTPYIEVKKQVIRDRLKFPFASWGPSVEQLNKKIIDGINGDYELLTALDEILSSEADKRDKSISIIKNLGKILMTNSLQYR